LQLNATCIPFTLFFFCFLEWHWWNQKFGCLQHAWHTPVPLHNSQSAMALLHGYPLGLFDHPSGPARYVISRRLAQRLTRTGLENGLRVRTKPSNAESVKKLRTTYFFSFSSFFCLVRTVEVAVKNYAVHQSLEDPGSASQQSECNDPAPH